MIRNKNWQFGVIEVKLHFFSAMTHRGEIREGPSHQISSRPDGVKHHRFAWTTNHFSLVGVTPPSSVPSCNSLVSFLDPWRAFLDDMAPLLPWSCLECCLWNYREAITLFRCAKQGAVVLGYSYGESQTLIVWFVKKNYWSIWKTIFLHRLYVCAANSLMLQCNLKMVLCHNGAPSLNCTVLTLNSPRMSPPTPPSQPLSHDTLREIPLRSHLTLPPPHYLAYP